MRVEPLPLLEVISLTPAITPSRRSSGVATLVAMVSGLAPGRLALTEIAGKSTCGSGDDRQHEEGGDAGQRHADGQQHRGDRAPDEGRGEVHARCHPCFTRRPGTAEAGRLCAPPREGQGGAAAATPPRSKPR